MAKTPKAMNPPLKLPRYCFEKPIALGRNPPPRAPISPTRLIATGVAYGNLNGTNWKVEPFAVPSAENITINMPVITYTFGINAAAKRLAIIM